MAQNAQLDAPFTSDAANWDSYHSPMEGNRPPVSAPPGPPTPWPPYYPPAQPARRWLPVAIIVAAIILAAALIGAVILSRGPNTAAPAAPAPTSIAGAPAPANAAVDSSTCKAWQSTKPALDAIPALPDGWDWNTPNINTYISNRNAAITKALNLFEPKISDTPADVAAAARGYVAAKRDEVRMLADRSFTSADAVSVNTTYAQLNQICSTK
ncbi:hypothetical protein [Mycobacterium avium]|uniref:hypothetical protein n=1 Tax=Mycobacterium avium TaxID=1764 RepID=UPI001155F5D3|nr:hypothetical protein [Mycobacterium avium]